MRLTNTTWFYINSMLTLRGSTNPKKLFPKDDTSLYLVVVKICWQSNVSKGRFQGVFTDCDRRVKSLCNRKQIVVLAENAAPQRSALMPVAEMFEIVSIKAFYQIIESTFRPHIHPFVCLVFTS